MPSVNLGPKVRFALYLIGSLASLGVVYAVDKAWAGDAEVRLVQGVVALITLLAAANTNTSSEPVVSVSIPEVQVDSAALGQSLAKGVAEGTARGAGRKNDDPQDKPYTY